jgi:hypothetical protein
MYEGEFPTIDKWGGKAWRVRRLVERDVKTWSAFNPSIAKDGDGRMLMTIRSSNYVIMPETGQLYVTDGGFIRNRVWMSWVSDELEITEPARVNIKNWADFEFVRGVEDAKPFWVDGQWFFTAVVLERHQNIARQGLLTFDPDKLEAEMVALYPGVRDLKPEKNWMYISGTKPFEFVYSPSVTVCGGYFTDIKKSKKVPDTLRGTSNIVDTSIGLIGMGHHLYTKKTRRYNQMTFGMQDGLLKDYTHRFVLYKPNGEVDAMTPEFRFYGPGIEFASGLVEHNGKLVVSFGTNDIRSNFATIDVGKIQKKLRVVGIDSRRRPV